MERREITCERCGSTRFSTEDDGRNAVCMECGMESQEFLNTAFDDWAEEARLYQGQGGGGRFLRRRGELAGRKSQGGKGHERLPLPDVDALLYGYSRVARGVSRALVDRCGVDGAVAGAVDRAWAAYAARVRRGVDAPPRTKPRKKKKKKRPRPSTNPEAARSRERRARKKAAALGVAYVPPPPVEEGSEHDPCADLLYADIDPTMLPYAHTPSSQEIQDALPPFLPRRG